MLGMRLMTGVLVGAGLVYFLDPDQGAKRRARVRHLWEQNQEHVRQAVNEASDNARRAGRQVVDRVEQRTGSASAG